MRRLFNILLTLIYLFAATTPAIAEGNMTQYEIREVAAQRDDMQIYGELYLPDGAAPYPLVILSHGFGGNHRNCEAYAQAFASHGMAAYVFDFIGGGWGSQSDGEMIEMSVLTEAADLNAVLDQLKAREDIDDRRIFLFGESQGGFVSTYVAGTRPEDVAGLIALYPAYVLQDDSRKLAPDENNIPETVNIMGSTVGAIYLRDAMSFDIYEVMAGYTGKTLIIHGTADSIVPISYSERAVTVLPDAELIRIDRANHGFWGGDQEEAAEMAVQFAEELLRESSHAVDAVSSATLSVKTMPAISEHVDSNTLIVYFSTNDTLRAIARIAADEIGADVFEIVPQKPYTEEDINYHQPGNRAGEEQWSGARPEIAALPEDFDRYDTILLGYPIWGGQAPNILCTFLESVHLHDVTMIPFCTSNFVGPGSSAVNLAAATDATVTWLPAVRIERGSTEEDIRAWADSLNLNKKENAEMKLMIGNTEVPVTWEDNASVKALQELAPLTVQLSMYGGFEQVGPIGQSITRDDHQMTTSAGDIVLYSGNQVVVFYGSNSWAYTKLGHIDLSKKEMTDLLGHGDTILSFFTE